MKLFIRSSSSPDKLNVITINHQIVIPLFVPVPVIDSCQLRPCNSINIKMLSSLTMKTIIALTYVATTTLVVSASVIGGAGNLARRDTTPGFELDPLTTEYCSYYWDTAGEFTCDQLVEVWGLTMADFTRWVSVSFHTFHLRYYYIFIYYTVADMLQL
jgi:hypothetical protein